MAVSEQTGIRAFQYFVSGVQGPPEDEVDPGVQALADVVALQRLAVQAHKLVRAAVGPRRQLHAPQLGAVL